MNMSQRGHLTPSEKTLTAQTLQIHMLDAIAKGAKNKSGRMVFHGGTSIATVRGSDRWSEDLDFVISPSMAEELEKIRGEVEDQANRRIQDITPGAEFELLDKGFQKGKVRVADPGTVMRWTGRWKHPNRLGVVKVKVEFYVAQPHVVALYDADEAKPEAVGVRSFHELPCASLKTFWADKIMAMSARPAMKWRDVFDLGFIMERLGDVSDQDLIERLGIAKDSYRSSFSEVLSGLQRDMIMSVPEARETFIQEMEPWLPVLDYTRLKGNGSLDRYFDSCCSELERARIVISRLLNEPVPQITSGDEECGL